MSWNICVEVSPFIMPLKSFKLREIKSDLLTCPREMKTICKAPSFVLSKQISRMGEFQTSANTNSMGVINSDIGEYFVQNRNKTSKESKFYSEVNAEYFFPLISVFSARAHFKRKNYFDSSIHITF